MKVIPLNIEVCECGYEGSISVFVPSINRNIITSYNARNEFEIRKEFPIKSEVDVQFIIQFGEINSTTERIKQIGDSVIGIFRGNKIIDGDLFYLIDSEVLFLCENELGHFKAPETIDSWVKVSGEIQMLRLNYNESS